MTSRHLAHDVRDWGMLFFIVGLTGAIGLLVAIAGNTLAEAVAVHADTPQARRPPGHEKMLVFLKEIADQTPASNRYIGSAMAPQLREQVATLPANTPDLTKWRLHMQAGEAELRLGNEAKAIDQLRQARKLLPQLRGQISPLVANQTIFRLGVAYMRQGETQNCCLRHTPESCILPVQDGGVHTQQGSSRQAIAHFTEVLRNTTDELRLHLEAKWLLNIAYMTIGWYPEQVPGWYLIPAKAFKSEEQMPRFTDLAPHLGLDTFDLSGGAIADDFDNDGYLDLVVSTWDTAGQIRFFRNNQDGTFVDRTEGAGLLGLYGGLNLVQADYDNDGNTDVLVLRGAWLGKDGQYPNSLLRNNGNGTFTDVTFDAGLGEVHYPTQTATWGDYDNDGNLDLYIGNESYKALNAPCQLFHNNGDGTFTDVAADANVQNHGFTKAVIWGDYNGDRWPDLYVSNFEGANRLYHNNGDGSFRDVAGQLNIDRPTRSFPAWFWDFNNDGILDLYVSAYSAGIADIAASILGLPVRSDLARLYRGKGDGGFEEVANQYNLVHPTAPMGCNFGDLDNDGYLDFYLGTGYADYKHLMPNVMYRNQEGRGFVDVTYAGGFGHLQKGHGVAFADFDNDGDQDIFEQMGGAFPGDKFSNVLYKNPGFGSHWLTIQLVGTHSNRSGIGARIHATVIENGTRRSIYKHVNSGGSFGANPLRQTVGLGKASKIESLEIFWPTTGLTQTFQDVPTNQFIQIIEGERQYTHRTIKTTPLGPQGLDSSPPIAAEKAPNVVQPEAAPPKTVDTFEQKQKNEPSPEFVEQYNRGLDLSKSEHYLGAVTALEKAIQIDPTRAEAHYILGRIYLVNLAWTAEAIEALQTATRLDPRDGRGHQMLGVAYFKRAQYQKAIDALTRAIELEPKVQEDYPYHPYYDLGMVYLRQRKFDTAIQSFEQAIRSDPDQIRAYHSLGNAYVRSGNVEKGIEQIKKYQALKPYLNVVS